MHLSVVSPVYLAEEIVEELVTQLNASLSTLTQSFEIILVDDGSPDNCWVKIRQQCEQNPRVKGIQLSRNFGQHSAITAGIEAAQGEWVVVVDCDLQDRPEEIIALYHKALEGYDVVLASRTNRTDSSLKKLYSQLFYKVLSFLTGVKHDPSIANFGIYHRSVINSILQMQESIRFFPAMVNWVGFHKTTIPVDHGERFTGKSSYNFKKQLKIAIDIMLAYSNRPLKMIISLGILISLGAFVFASIILYRAFQGKIILLGYSSLIISICFFSGITISVLGILGLYLGKIFEGIKKRPIYLIKGKYERE
jgi:polyisoprenyl-phosphate glycosyltransferase